MFVGRLPPEANVRSLRVHGGLGTIARVVAENEEIYRRPLPVEAALDRIDTYYFPFHRALEARLDRLRRSFGW
ncbi:N-formylglutamate amidohydrolase, partial [Mycobacterium tuberculosis]|nr:N-formylglutamate amidohydrolase [Mycobacterium tuberculosis]